MKRLHVYLASGAALATIVIAWVTVMSYIESSAPVSTGATENPVEDDAGQSVDEVLIGYSVEELRKMNNVREMMELEDGQSLSDANGVYGFVFAFNRSFYGPLHDFDPLLHRDRLGDDFEIHKTPSGETMLLLYVDEGSVARLAGIDQVGDIFVFFSPHKTHNVLVAIPITRIVNLDYRGSNPPFAKVRVN